MTDTDLAEFFYAMYGEALGEDAPKLPAWDAIDDDTRARWVYVAEMAREAILSDADSELLSDVNELEDRLEDHRAALWAVLDTIKPILGLKVVDDLI